MKDFSFNSVKIPADSIYTSPVTHGAQYTFFIADIIPCILCRLRIFFDKTLLSDKKNRLIVDNSQ